MIFSCMVRGIHAALWKGEYDAINNVRIFPEALTGNDAGVLRAV